MSFSLVKLLSYQTLLILFTSPVFLCAQNASEEKILVKFSSPNPYKQKRSLSGLDAYSFQSYPGSKYASLELPRGQKAKKFVETQAFKQALKSQNIVAVEVDYAYSLSAIPNDPEYIKQWGLENTGIVGGTPGSDIQANLAWDIQTEGSGIMGLVDTGIDYTHPDLVDNIWQNLAEDADGDGKVLEWINGRWQLDPGDLDGIDADGNGYVDDLIGWDFVENDNDPMDENGHGTHVAGIAAARGNNGIGVAGVAWEAEIMVLKAFDRFGSGRLSSILPALEYARQKRVLLTNNSWGSVHKSRFLLEVIQLANQDNQIFVAAAGNNGEINPLRPVFPAAYDAENIIAVAASNQRERLSSFSNYGQNQADLVAPGSMIYSTLPGNRYGYKSGTSMAAPFVSGTLLLLHAHEPQLGQAALISRILEQVDIKPAFYGSKSNGRLNTYKCLDDGGTTSPQVLAASFRGPDRSCVNTPIEFVNTSHIPIPAQTQYSWEVNGQQLGADANLNHSFDAAGWYEVRLTLTDPQQQSHFTYPIEITAQAYADLGPDTSACVSRLLLHAGNKGTEIQWKKLPCLNPPYCDSIPMDSIRVQPIGGDLSGLVSRYLLTDLDYQILEVSENAVFSPQTDGQYLVYGMYFDPNTPPLGAIAGNYKDSIQFGADPCAAITSGLSLDVDYSTYLGKAPFLEVYESGIYVLEVVDACGNIAKDTLQVNIQGDCVWPGDVNADGKVSITDFLLLGIANQETGLQRIPASPSWTGQPGPLWSQSFDSKNELAPAINLKYADCNGDGIVDLDQDARVMQNNWGFFHQMDDLPVEPGPTVHLKHTNTRFSPTGDTATLDIEIYLYGPDSSRIDDFFGMAMMLNFSDPIVTSPNLNASQDWLGPMKVMNLLSDGSQNSFGSQFLPGDRRHAVFSMVSANRQSSFGRGLAGGGGIIVTIDDIIDSTQRRGLNNFSISANNILVIDSLGRVLSTHTASSLSMLEIPVNWTKESGDIRYHEWLDFKIDKTGEDAILTWLTEVEINSYMYIVEKSADNQHFEPMASLPAKGNRREGGSYTYVDEKFSSGKNNTFFYRIKELDADGNIYYSNTLSIFQEQSINLSVYPNPFQSELKISYRLDQSPGQLKIMNALGQILWESGTLQISGEQHISTKDWFSGLYFIVLETESGRQVHKVIKN